MSIIEVGMLASFGVFAIAATLLATIWIFECIKKIINDYDDNIGWEEEDGV